MPELAQTPEPPYYAVIFSSVLTAVDDRYGATADRMVELARLQPGFLGVDTAHSEGVGITVSYWESPEAIAGWRSNLEHAEAQRAGREKWYERFELRVARVERAYGFERAAT